MKVLLHIFADCPHVNQIPEF